MFWKGIQTLIHLATKCPAIETKEKNALIGMLLILLKPFQLLDFNKSLELEIDRLVLGYNKS